MDRSSRLPERLHHTAYVSRDLEATRHFYEGIIGLPLIATWCVPEMPQTPFVHIALKVDRDNQDAIWARLEQNGYREPDVFALEHGYCRSIYARDPNGMLIEFCCDADLGADLVEEKRATARSELQRWLAGDRSSNNHLSHR
ncbi:MAG: VOC family protein [Gammaproteobacteria bacterium]